MSEAIRIKRVLGAVALVAVALAATVAQGDILGFFPEPASPGMWEFVWDGSTLSEGSGARGTGYQQPGPGDTTAAPGLTMIVPFEIPGIPGGTVGIGSTSFDDTTLDITVPLAADGAAFMVGPLVYQLLGPGAFELWSTDPAAGGIEDDYVPLLFGTVNSALITGALGENTGATLSAEVSYTSGAIVDAMGGPFNGSFTWTLLDIGPPLAISATTGNLDAFDANGTGHFTPEPATMVLLGIGGLVATLRHRRNKNRV